MSVFCGQRVAPRTCLFSWCLTGSSRPQPRKWSGRPLVLRTRSLPCATRDSWSCRMHSPPGRSRERERSKRNLRLPGPDSMVPETPRARLDTLEGCNDVSLLPGTQRGHNTGFDAKQKSTIARKTLKNCDGVAGGRCELLLMTNVVTEVLPEKHARVLKVWEHLPVVTKAVI